MPRPRPHHSRDERLLARLERILEVLDLPTCSARERTRRDLETGKPIAASSEWKVGEAKRLVEGLIHIVKSEQKTE